MYTCTHVQAIYIDLLLITCIHNTYTVRHISYTACPYMPTSLRSFVQMAVELGYEEEDPTAATTLTPFDPQGGNEGTDQGEGESDKLGVLGQLSYTDLNHHQQGHEYSGATYDQRHDRSDTLDGDPHYNHSIHPFSNDDILGHNSDPSSPRNETPFNTVPKPKIKFQKAVISPFNYTLSSLALTPTPTTTTASATATATNTNNSSSGSCKIVPPSREGGDFIPPPKLAVPTPQTHTSTANNNNTSVGTHNNNASSGTIGTGSLHSSSGTTPTSNEKGRRKGQNYDQRI